MVQTRYMFRRGQSMRFSGKIVQVARPSLENSLAVGIVGTAYMAIAGGEIFGLYILFPEDDSALKVVWNLLFTEAELEELPR